MLLKLLFLHLLIHGGGAHAMVRMWKCASCKVGSLLPPRGVQDQTQAVGLAESTLTHQAILQARQKELSPAPSRLSVHHPPWKTAHVL